MRSSWLAATALLLGLLFAMAAFGQQPLDPRPNKNVTPLDTYVLISTHMPDIINLAGIPAPLIERMNAGESWFDIEPCRNSWSFNGANKFYGSLSSWVPAAQNVHSQILWTMTAPPLWATTAAGIAKTSCVSGTDNVKQNPGPPPADSYYDISTGATISTYASEVCKAVNALGTTGGGDTPLGDGTLGWSHGDCIIKELATAIMQETCHINHRPSSPLVNTCDIHYFEGQNEWDVNQQWGQQSGSLNALAATQSDFARVMKLYCADCYFFAGSASCGGKQFFGFCDQGQGLLLDAWHVVSPSLNPDGASIHPYPGVETVYPNNMPEGPISGTGSGTQTGYAGGVSVNTAGSGYTLNDLLTVLGGNSGLKVKVTCLVGFGGTGQPACSASGTATAGVKSITVPQNQAGDNYSTTTGLSTSGGTGAGAKINITTIFSTNGSGGSSLCPLTGQSPAFRFCKSLIDEVHDVRAQMNTRTWLAAGVPIIGTEGGDYFNDQEWDTVHANPFSGETSYSAGLSRAYIIRTALIVGDWQNPLYGTGGGLQTNNWYEADNTTPDCFGDEYLGSAYPNISSGCVRSGHNFTLPSGMTPYGIGHRTVAQWLANVKSWQLHCNDVSSSNVQFNAIWTCTVLRNDGTPAQFLWDTGWERNQSMATTYPFYQDGQGNTHTVVGGVVHFGPEPIMLFGAIVSQGPAHASRRHHRR